VPAHPQLLAFATSSRVGVLAGRRIRYVGSVPAGTRLARLAWSGDGRQLAWTSSDSDASQQLTMVDVTDGRRHTWLHTSGAIGTGLRGVVVPADDSRFAEYLPDGTRRTFPVRLPRPRRRNAEVDGTSVNLALPLDGQWLVLAEHNALVGRGGPVRAFRYDPQRMALTVERHGTGMADSAVDLGRGDAAWIEHRSGSYCLSSDGLDAVGMHLPQLPARPDGRTWGIRRLEVAHGVQVLATGTGQSDSGCDSDPDFRWLTLRDGRWVERERGLIDLDVATDGRVARVRGRLCGETEVCPHSEYLSVRPSGAQVSEPGATSLELPRGTTQVRFSPAFAGSLREAGGSGPPLSASMRLTPRGLQPLRFGATPAELQRATATPLSFELDARGCGVVVPTDVDLWDALGLEGRIVDGRLAALVVWTRDLPTVDGDDVDYEPDVATDLWPSVRAVRARGPRTDRGVGAGDTVDLLIERYGLPSAHTAPTALGAVTYTYRLGRRTLVARADGRGVIRRLWLGDRTQPVRCAGGR
jgi:hypothetical protein